MSKKPMTYADAGVNLDAWNVAKDKIEQSVTPFKNVAHLPECKTLGMNKVSEMSVTAMYDFCKRFAAQLVICNLSEISV